MKRLVGMLALVAGVSGCVAAPMYDDGYGNDPRYYAPRTDIGIGVGGSGGGNIGGGAGVGVGF
ncbi:hypothetical protein [Paraburkholderia aromaticivorans]|uniref:hypothetical protein n=1 Tax=Paraburkholderia aromaticivorans TaxID=2026199 RepID=UPI001455E040|nr:hypothetical protein [Paraburkholderia aromaticivorans]